MQQVCSAEHMCLYSKYKLFRARGDIDVDRNLGWNDTGILVRYLPFNSTKLDIGATPKKNLLSEKIRIRSLQLNRAPGHPI